MRRIGIYAAAGFACGIMLQKMLCCGACFLLVSQSIAFLAIIAGIRRRTLYRFRPRSTYQTIAVISFFIISGMYRYTVRSPDYAPPVLQKIYAESGTIRQSCERRIMRILRNEETYATAIALTLGDKSMIGKDLKKSYKNAGVMHALALSGLHVGIIWSILQSLLSILSFSLRTRRLQAALIIAVIFFYVMITGLTPSAVRAGIMLAIWKISEILSRRNDTISSLALAGSIILLFDPSVIFKPGFQLSFAATAGIALIYPVINRSIKNIIPINVPGRLLMKGLRKTMELAGISISCTIATLPLALSYFGYAPQNFLIANTIAIPMVTLSVYSVAASMITAPLPFLGRIAAAASNFILSALENVVRYLGS